jgi:hypothetical protein
VKEKDFKPYNTLLFLITAFSLLGLVASVFPKEGIYITENFSLNFPSLSSIFKKDTTEIVDISSILAIVDSDTNESLTIKPDTLFKKDSVISLKKTV